MTDSSSDPPPKPCAAMASFEETVAGTVVVGASPDGTSPLEELAPIEREGARYGYRRAGRPFGQSRRGLENWLRLRARAKANHAGETRAMED